MRKLKLGFWGGPLTGISRRETGVIPSNAAGNTLWRDLDGRVYLAMAHRWDETRNCGARRAPADVAKRLLKEAGQ